MKDFFESYCQLRSKLAYLGRWLKNLLILSDHAKIIIVSSSIDIFGGIVTLNLDWV